MKNKGQVSLEFIIIFSFALIIFILLLAVLLQFMESGRNTRILQEFDFVANSISKNLLIASKGPGTVELEFALPEKIAGYNYEVLANHNELIVNSIDAPEDYQIYKTIPFVDAAKVQFESGKNHNIKMQSDEITVVQV